MSKSVTLKAEAVFGKNFTVVDTGKNVKLINAGLKKMYEAIDKMETNKGEQTTVMDYQETIQPVVIEETGKLIGLDKADTKKLEDISYSELFGFYSKAVNEFLGMDAPNVREIAAAFREARQQVAEVAEETDPKSDNAD